ncbi:MAG: transcription-repair coupling factor [Flavobacteriales bacterium]|nr:transcription-repair coupling factor [Flavobacteriales bacterium]
MNIPELKAKFANSEQSGLLVEFLQKNQSGSIYLKGVIGSSISFISNAVFQSQASNMLFIANDKEEAAYLLNDLESVVGEENILFFPASYKKAYHVEDTENSNILMRSDVLNILSTSSAPKIIVTYADALAEKVVNKSVLKKNTLEIAVKEEYSLEFINEVLYEYGFEREDFVIEPGQFSIRGGIIDIFSFSNNQPYRIEFFGDEIESIRTFDPVTQLSTKNFQKITIIPNLQTGMVVESRESLIDFMPNSTVLWCSDIELTSNLLDNIYSKATTEYKKTENSPIKRFEPQFLYLTKDEFINQIKNRNTVEFGIQHFFSDSIPINFRQKPQPEFNKNFSLLYENFLENNKTDYTNILLTENSKQAERLHTIFDDIGKEIHVFSLLLPIHQGFIDSDLQICCYTDHQIFNRYQRFKLKNTIASKGESLTLKEIHGLAPGDFITHIDHGVGRFSGLEKIDVNGKTQEAIRIIYSNNDLLYVNIHSLHKISKYVGKDGTPPKINRLGSTQWQITKQKTKARIKEVAFDLIKLYAQRKSTKGFQFMPDTYLQTELEASFIYEDTPDQLKATLDVKKDMEAEYPMDRLICGDVGFGKTEIAIRAAFKAVADSKQVAVLVPTTILALQHYKTFKARLKNFPCNVDYINRFKSPAQQKNTLERLAKGEVDIIIGTHRIVGKDVNFKDLGLLIIDEEQKFGVSVKDKLKTIKANVDTLTLTATPIPRTLQFSLMAARDLSNITTPPPNRQPVETKLNVFNEEIIRDAVSFEVSRGGQVFFVNNRVENIKEVAGMIQRLCPDVSVLTAHGQMNGDELEQKMMAFVDGEFDVLVATTIIESGLDIPNANTIIINNANHFGLSDLHQMRGRVGRSNKKAFCYLLAPPMHELTPEARKRLIAIEQYADLGSGFQIAMRDLDIRGAGNLLGAEQSGFISEIGFDMYQKILHEAIEELKESDFSELYAEELKSKNYSKDCQLETDLELLIPDSYISNIAERLTIYRDIDELENESQIEKYKETLKDRFGDIPNSVNELFEALLIRKIAAQIGFEKLVLKQQKLIGYFIVNQDSDYYKTEQFTHVLKYVQTQPLNCKLKEKNERLSLVFENIQSVHQAKEILLPLLFSEKIITNS